MDYEKSESFELDLAEEIDALVPPTAEERLESFVSEAADRALSWRDEDLDAEQSEATDYYMGRPFGNEEEGRSQVVSTDVRDTVQAVLPSLMRIFFGIEDVVEYGAEGPEDEKSAAQATDYINKIVIRGDNRGFLTVHGALKDALVRKLGVIKWWWEDKVEKEGRTFTGLTEEQAAMLQADEDVDEFEVESVYPLAGMPDAPMLIDAYAHRTLESGLAKIACVPPEEFIFSPDARSLEEAELVGHARAVPASDLIAMGFDPDTVNEKKGRIRGGRGLHDQLPTARRFDLDEWQQMDSDQRDESREEVFFGELYVYADMSEEQDGIAELVKVRTLGDDFELYDWEPCSQRPFALFCPDPEPHTIIGLSYADYTKDIQLVKSAIIRGQLDSLTLTVNPRTEVVEGEVNMADVMNPEIGGVIRVEKPGMIREIAHSFVGKEAFPMLQYMDEQKENRTGISKAAAGLDADALQSSTKAAVAATMTGAQQHIELLARIFSETGFAQLYKGLLQLVTENQDRKRTVRLRNEWVEVDPSSWNSNMDVRINLALGAGDDDTKVQKLLLILQEQKELLMQGSPLVGLSEFRHTLGRIVELAGFANSEAFYKTMTPEQEQQMQQQQAQQPDPQMMAMQAQIQLEEAKLKLDWEKAMLEDQRKRDEMMLDFALKQATAEIQYGAQINDAELKADMEIAKALVGADAQVRTAPVTPAGQPQSPPMIPGGQNG
jgi:hypothetical protein